MRLTGKVALVTGAQQGIGPASAAAMVAQVVDELGGIDVLVNNAGVYPRVPLLEMRESDWDLVLDVNLKGGFFCAQAAARAMVAGRRRGSVINMASQAIRGAVRGVHYSASKGGVVAMTRAMALELAPHRIRVNAIAPGLTDTAQPRYGNSEEELAAMARAVPLGHRRQLLLAVAVARLRGVGESRRDRVHADAMRRELERHRARHRHDA